MIKCKLPIWEKHFDEGQCTVTTTDKDIEVEINTTVLAEERWEALFPQNSKTETLFNYIGRVVKNNQIEGAYLTSSLKALFCFIESDEIADFKAFCRFFDLSDASRLEKLISKIKSVFDAVLNSSTVSPKN